MKGYKDACNYKLPISEEISPECNIKFTVNSNNNRSNSIHDCGNVYGNSNLCYIDIYYYYKSARQLVMPKQIQIDDWAAFQRESTATVPYLQGI